MTRPEAGSPPTVVKGANGSPGLVACGSDAAGLVSMAERIVARPAGRHPRRAATATHGQT
ncbi:MAG: hypothetical protein WDM84_01275 [Bauldia sp.]